MIDPVIFRAYDLRGIYPEQINEETAFILGQSFGTYVLKENITKVIVAHDNRLSSPSLSEFLIKGLMSTGVDVINLGMITTPMFYYARLKLNVWAGLMITASHNPKEYNGFKISFNNIGNAAGKEIEEFRDFTLEGKFAIGEGTLSTYNIREEYIQMIKNSLNIGERKIKAVFDAGNGTVSLIIKDVLDILNIEYDLLYCDSDGTFPNHHPDPSVAKNLVDLQKRVVELNYDLGIAVDADGDRVKIVDNLGNIVNSDILMIIIYRYLNENLSVRKAIFDVKCSRSLIDELEKLNIEPIMWRTGNSYLYRKVHEEKVDFAAEYSGHIFFVDKFPGLDDGLYAGLRVIEILSKNNQNLSDLYDGINHYFSTDEIKVAVTEDTKFKIIDQIKNYAITKNYNYIDIDGVRINFSDGWALIRASNTGPDLTTRYEAKTEDRLKEINEEFSNLLKEIKINYLR